MQCETGLEEQGSARASPGCNGQVRSDDHVVDACFALVRQIRSWPSSLGNTEFKDRILVAGVPAGMRQQPASGVPKKQAQPESTITFGRRGLKGSRISVVIATSSNRRQQVLFVPCDRTNTVFADDADSRAAGRRSPCRQRVSEIEHSPPTCYFPCQAG